MLGAGYGLAPQVITADIAAGAVTNAKLANMAAATVKGSILGGVPADLTIAELIALIQASSGIVTTFSKILVLQTFNSDVMASITGMSFPVVSGSLYRFSMASIVSSALLATGISCTLTTPTFTHFAANSRSRLIAADGTDSVWESVINASGDAAIPTSSFTANAKFLYVTEGIIVPSAAGTVQLQMADETAQTDVISHHCGVTEVRNYGA